MKILSKGTYYGSKKSELHFNGVVLSEYDYLTKQTDWHFHENPYFMYILKGNLFDVNKQQKTECPPGSLMYYNWHEAHFNSKETNNARGFHIEFEKDWILDKKPLVNIWEGSKLIHHPELHHLLGKIYFEYNCQDAVSPISIELLLLTLCEGLSATQESNQLTKPRWVKHLQELLHSNVENLNLDFLSNELGVHPVHISRAVPKYFASTLGEYIRKVKIQEAVALIMNSNYSLTEIAYTCGFSDHSHFTRTFKRYFGMTPKIFRFQLKKGN